MSRSTKEVPSAVIDPFQRWLTVSDSARYLRLCVQSVRAFIHQGELRAIHFGNTYRIDRKDLDELMLRKKKTVAPYRKGTHAWVRDRHAQTRKAGAR